MAMQVAFQVGGLQALNQQVQSLQRVNQQLNNTVAKAPKLLSGPMQRVESAQANLARATLTGSAAQRFDAQHVLAQRQRALLRAQGPSPALEIAGKGLAALRVAAQLAGAAILTFSAAALAGARQLGEAANARTVSGGTAQNIATLQAMGIGSAQIAGLAASLRERLAGGGLGAVLGQQMGLGQHAGPASMGVSNQAQLLQGAIQGIAGLATAEERLRAARALELDGLLPQIEAYRRNSAAMQADAAARAKVADTGTLQAAADLGNALGRVKGNFELLLQSLGKPVLKDLAAFANTVADALRGLALSIDPAQIQQFAAAMGQMFLNMSATLEFFGVFKHGATSYLKAVFDHHRQLANATASAAQAASQAAQQAWQAGTYGGGSRARGAMPSKFNGWAANPALNGGALRFGAFAL